MIRVLYFVDYKEFASGGKTDDATDCKGVNFFSLSLDENGRKRKGIKKYRRMKVQHKDYRNRIKYKMHNEKEEKMKE